MNNLTTSAETNRLRSAPTFFLRFDVGNHTMSVEEKCAKGKERERERERRYRFDHNRFRQASYRSIEVCYDRLIFRAKKSVSNRLGGFHQGFRPSAEQNMRRKRNISHQLFCHLILLRYTERLQMIVEVRYTPDALYPSRYPSVFIPVCVLSVSMRNFPAEPVLHHKWIWLVIRSRSEGMRI